jgi:transcriptional regulator with XRE-family HTH domain
VPAYEEEHRVWFRPEWRVSDGTVLRFNTVITSWSDYNAAFAMDWHPADGSTWDWLNRTAPTPAMLPPSPDVGIPNVTDDAHRPENDAVGAPGTWFELLRAAREGAGMTRFDLAEATGISPKTVEKYEFGASRRPRREIILRFTHALDLDGTLTNVILTRARLDPEPSDWALLVARRHPRTSARFRTHPDVNLRILRANIPSHINAHAWPCVVVDESCDIAHWNPPFAGLLGPAGMDELRGPGRRNLVRFVLGHWLQERVVNWEEVAAALLPASLRARTGGHGHRSVPRGIRSSLDDARRQDPTLPERLSEMWRTAPPPLVTSHVAVPLLWRTISGPVLAFNCIVAPWTAVSGTWAIDWHPADAATWEWIERAHHQDAQNTALV